MTSMERRGSQHQSSRSTSSPGFHPSHGRSRSLGPNGNLASLIAGGMGGGGGPGSAPMSPAGTMGSPLLGDTGWEDIQARTFCKWLNTKLESRGLEPMRDLVKDFSDGVKLIQLLEIMSDTPFPRYNRKPIMRVQKAENASMALNFIRERQVKLTNIGPEDIVDGNLKLILGMIWTLILRFTIGTITEEGISAKDGLLLWCQRKTQGYEEVNVKDFKKSFADGLAFCALIHHHRPDLLDYHALDKEDRRANTELAFRVAEELLGIPRILEVKDLCDVEVPDERSVMTYVAEFFLKFSSEDKMETGARRIEKFVDVLQGVWTNKNDFERRISLLLQALAMLPVAWTNAPRPLTIAEATLRLQELDKHKQNMRREWVRERQDLATLYSNIQSKIRVYALKAWEPKDGCRLADLDGAWEGYVTAERKHWGVIHARIRGLREELKRDWANRAEGFVRGLREVEKAIGTLRGPLSDQKTTLSSMLGLLTPIRQSLMTAVQELHERCIEAGLEGVEGNEYSVLTFGDLEWELEAVEAAVKRKIAFVDNQVASSAHSNITPERLEQLEATFRHFDKDETNDLSVWELKSAMASEGIVYEDDVLDDVYNQMLADYGAATFNAFLDHLVEMERDDISSPDQLHDAFRGMAKDKGYVTDIDFNYAHLPKETIRFLTEVMPGSEEARTNGDSGMKGTHQSFDYDKFLHTTFARYSQA